MNAENFKYKVTIDILTPQVDGAGNYVRYNEVTIFEQKVINLQVEAVIAVVNNLTIPLPPVDFVAIGARIMTGDSNG